MKFNWNAAVRVDLFGNPKHSRERRLAVAKKFKNAGCLDLGFSLESANKEILEMMNKRIEAEYFLEQVRVLEEVGIHCSISVVFGYPIETPKTIKETFDMCFEAKIYGKISADGGSGNDYYASGGTSIWDHGGSGGGSGGHIILNILHLEMFNGSLLSVKGGDGGLAGYPGQGQDGDRGAEHSP